jgi:hypothetical protein
MGAVRVIREISKMQDFAGTPADGKALVYSSSTSKWMPQVVTPAGLAGATLNHILTSDGTGGVKNTSVTVSDTGDLAVSTKITAPNHIETVLVSVDGNGGVITAGSKGFRQINQNGVITGWTILADQVGSCVIDIKKSSYANYPTTASVTASATPALVSALKNTDSTLTGWTTAIAAGDILEFVVSSPLVITRVTLLIYIRRT